MRGHHNIAADLKMIASPDFVQSGEKESPRHRRVQQWSPLVTAESEKVKVPESVVAF